MGPALAAQKAGLEPALMRRESAGAKCNCCPHTPLPQGSRMLPLLKLCLLENLQLSTAAEEAAEAAAASGRAPSDAASAGLQAPGRGSAASDAAGSDGASNKSSAGPAEGPAAGAAAGASAGPPPAGPATPARPVRSREALPPPSTHAQAAPRGEPALQAHRRPPSPPPPAQDPRQRSVQQHQQQASQAQPCQPSAAQVSSVQPEAGCMLHAPHRRWLPAHARSQAACARRPVVPRCTSSGGPAVQPGRPSGPQHGAPGASGPAGRDGRARCTTLVQG